MKNHEYIRKLPVKELAQLLVCSEEVNEGDEGMDGEWEDYYVTHYICPNGGFSYDYEDAVLHTIDWLNADRKEEPNTLSNRYEALMCKVLSNLSITDTMCDYLCDEYNDWCRVNCNADKPNQECVEMWLSVNEGKKNG